MSLRKVLTTLGMTFLVAVLSLVLVDPAVSAPVKKRGASPVQGLRVLSVGSDQAVIAWDAPAQGRVTGYTVILPVGKLVLGARARQAVVTGLPSGQGTVIKVRPLKGRKAGPVSTVVVTTRTMGAATTQSPPVATYGPIRNVSISATASGDHVNWSASWDANGKPVKVVITRNGNTLWSSNSTGSNSTSGSDAIGYSKTGNYVITVSDPGRASRTDSKSVTTPPPPPPPPPGVTVTKGAQANIGTCTVAACRWVVVTTKNFPGSVSCHISNAYPNTSGFVSWNQGANETKQTLNIYGYPGKSVTVTCNGVSGSTTW